MSQQIKEFLALVFFVFLYIALGLTVSPLLSLGSVLIPIILAIFGFLIPFLSLKTAWWFYTLGGKMPISEQNQWLVQYGHSKSKANYAEYAIRFGYIATLTILIVREILRRGGNELFLIKLLALISIFGLGLMIGTGIKKKKLGL